MLRTEGMRTMAGDDEKAKKYRVRALEVRVEAEALANRDAGQMLLDVAASYERLAAALDSITRRSDR
jgi:hypothetical protein